MQIGAINSHTLWQTVQIQISWLLKKPTDLDRHCLQRQGLSGFSRTRFNHNLKCCVFVMSLLWSVYNGLNECFFFFFFSAG